MQGASHLDAGLSRAHSVSAAVRGPRALKVAILLQADLAQQREAAVAAESRATAAAEETAQLRAELEAARSAPQHRQQSEEVPAAHATGNGHAENGAVSAEEQVMGWPAHELCSTVHGQVRYLRRSTAF